MQNCKQLDYSKMYLKIKSEIVLQGYRNISRFCEYIKMSSQPFYNLKNGLGINLETAYRICQALGKPLDWIIEDGEGIKL